MVCMPLLGFASLNPGYTFYMMANSVLRRSVTSMAPG